MKHGGPLNIWKREVLSLVVLLVPLLAIAAAEHASQAALQSHQVSKPHEVTVIDRTR
jgi:hypothetical protein